MAALDAVGTAAQARALEAKLKVDLAPALNGVDSE